jgi:hypothetical protein
LVDLLEEIGLLLPITEIEHLVHQVIQPLVELTLKLHRSV